MEERFVGAADVAERLGVAPDTVARWCREGRIPGMRPGRDWRIPWSVVEDLQAGRPSRHWSADLERQLGELREPAHVLALVPGREHDARRFAEVTADLGLPVRCAPDPPMAPAGGIFPRTALLAAARAWVAAEVDLVAEAEQPIVVRFVGRIREETLAAERRVDAAARAGGRIVLCIAPLAARPDVGSLLRVHTHLLLAAVHGRSWLSRAGAEPARWARRAPGGA